MQRCFTTHLFSSVFLFFRSFQCLGRGIAVVFILRNFVKLFYVFFMFSGFFFLFLFFLFYSLFVWFCPMVCPWLRPKVRSCPVLCHGWHWGMALYWCGEMFFVCLFFNSDFLLLFRCCITRFPEKKYAPLTVYFFLVYV